MTEVKAINGEVLFSYDESKTTLREEISNHRNLRWANLIGADLRGANLYHTDLSGADLSEVDLFGANLHGVNLYGANLKGADLSYADLRYAYLIRADLFLANLKGADLTWADLSGAKNVPDIDFPMACPEEGSFVAWKKVAGRYVIKLEIPEDAKRSSATSKKCRCDKAKVLEIIDLETGEKIDEVVNTNYAPCTYKVGEMAYPDSFDDDRWNECSHGIHFFINREDAEDY